jgi:hypothetical protein
MIDLLYRNEHARVCSILHILCNNGESKLQRMYKIGKDRDGVVFLCRDCSHTERIDSFNESLGSRRTQVARAMQNHSRDKHGTESMLKPIPHNYGVMKQW